MVKMTIGEQRRKRAVIHALKATTLVLFALGIYGATGKASASTVVTHVPSEGSHVFKAGEHEVACAEATVNGTASTLEEEKTLTLHPTYGGCTFLGEAATIDTTGCNFVLHAATSSGHGKTELECTGGNAIKVTTSACNLTFAAQTATGGVSYSNLGSGKTRDITAKFTDTLTFTKSGPLCASVSGNTATYSGSLTLKGYEDEGGPSKEDEFCAGAQKGIWWEGEEFRTE